MYIFPLRDLKSQMFSYLLDISLFLSNRFTNTWNIPLGQGPRQRNGYIISLRNFLSRCKSCTINDSKVRVLITLLGSLRYLDGDGHENVAWKVNLLSFNPDSDYSNSFTLSNASELFSSRIPKNHIQVQKEKENLAVANRRPFRMLMRQYGLLKGHRGIFCELFTFTTSICRLYSGAEWRILGATFHKRVR